MTVFVQVGHCCIGLFDAMMQVVGMLAIVFVALVQLVGPINNNMLASETAGTHVHSGAMAEDAALHRPLCAGEAGLVIWRSILTRSLTT